MIGLGLDGQGSAEIGYWLAAEARGSGLMTETVRLVADHAFDPKGLGLQRLIWHASVGNWASRRVAWRLGFTVEGTIRAHLPKHGERQDAWVATLLAGDPMQPVRPWFEVPTLRGDGVVLRRWRDSRRRGGRRGMQ